MSNTQTSLPPTTETPASTPRETRGAAAVIAQYIKDLTTTATHGPRAATA
ncbi:MAG TPA: hypothetical protein VFW09_16400 [Solirubrobacteraceae bacterium]|nr:hypothetical protein [Solirubrobacteraceae bacterium]